MTEVWKREADGILLRTDGAVVFTQLREIRVSPPVSDFSAPTNTLTSSFFPGYFFPIRIKKEKWPQTPSTGSERACVSMTTQRYVRRSKGRAQCAVFTSWTRGSQARPTSESTGGGKMIFYF